MAKNKYIEAHRAKKKKGTVQRTASAPLHVMLEPEDLERYKQLAKDRDMTLRDLVRSALEAEWSRWQDVIAAAVPPGADADWQSFMVPPEQQATVERLQAMAAAADEHVAALHVAALRPTMPLPPVSFDSQANQRQFLSHSQRLGRLEAQLENILQRLDRHGIREV